MKILIINAGSSSLKYQLIDPDNGEVFAKGLCERIGVDGRLTHNLPATGEKYQFDTAMPTHVEATQAVIDALLSEEYGVIASLEEIDAVGHRLVQAGEHNSHAMWINEDVMQILRDNIPLAPLHNPANITGIEACEQVMPGVPMVGVPDTMFHDYLPEMVSTYAIPEEFREKDAVRRYGYHGISHCYVSGRGAELVGKPREELKIICCHLGSGSSVTAVKGGHIMDTSLGMSTMSGLPMGTRCGDIDPGVIEFVMNKNDLTAEQMFEILMKKSGVYGISGLSSDFRDLKEAADQGNHRAELALDTFHYNVKKRIGSFAAAMGGVDLLLFTGGIGENAIDSRMAIASGLEFLGIKMDAEANNVRGKEAVLSAADSSVPVLLVPTNEELVIARETAALLNRAHFEKEKKERTASRILTKSA